jgi:hypothetical protein
VACVAHILNIAVQEMLGTKGLGAQAPDAPLEPGNDEDGLEDLTNGDFGDDLEDNDGDGGDDTEDEEEDDEEQMAYGPSFIAIHGNPIIKLRNGIAKIRYALFSHMFASSPPSLPLHTYVYTERCKPDSMFRPMTLLFCR